MQGAALALAYVAQGRCQFGMVTRFSNGVWVALQKCTDADKPASAWLYGPYIEETGRAEAVASTSGYVAMESAQEPEEDAGSREPDAFDDEGQLLSPFNPALYLVVTPEHAAEAADAADTQHVTRLRYLFAAPHEMHIKRLLRDWIPATDRVPNWGNLSLPLSQWRCLDEGVVATDPVTSMPTAIRLAHMKIPHIPASLAHMSTLKKLTLENCGVDAIDEGAFGALARVCISQNGSGKLTYEGMQRALQYNVGLEEVVLS